MEELLATVRVLGLFWLAGFAYFVAWDLTHGRKVELADCAMEGAIWPLCFPVRFVLWAADRRQ